MIRRGKDVAVVVAPVFINGVAVARRLARVGSYIVGVDSSSDSPGLQSRFVKERVIVESPSQSEGAFTAFLLSRKDLYGALVIPTDDFHVRELYRNRAALAEHYRLCISQGNAVEIAMDKAFTAATVALAGINAPRTRLIANVADLHDAARYVGFPAIVKPTFSISFSRKFGTKSFLVKNEADLKAGFERASAGGEAVVLQEMIPGGDDQLATYTSYWDEEGRLAGDFVARKLLQHPPIFGVGQVHKAEPIQEVIDGCRQFYRHIGYAGAVSSSEWKYDHRDGKWKFLEFNARTHMQIALAQPAGCDVIEMMRRDKLGLPQIGPGKIRYGLKWVYIKNGILRQVHYPEHRQSIVELVKTYRPPVVFAMFSLEDMRPFIADLLPMLERHLPWRKRSKGTADPAPPGGARRVETPLSRHSPLFLSMFATLLTTAWNAEAAGLALNAFT